MFELKARTYALSLAAIAAALFLGVAAANVIIDPFAVFGTGLLPQSRNINDRYRSFSDYQAAPQMYDGLFFGSSRAGRIPREELTQRIDGVVFASFAVVGGSFVDYLPMLEFVLRDKRARGERLRAVFLALDVDGFGGKPFTNSSNQFLLPPALSGESAARFWWKNLTSIQFNVWRAAIADARRARVGAQRPDADAARLLRRLLALAGDAASPGVAKAQPSAPSAPPARPPRKRVTDNFNFPKYLTLLERLVTICREQGIDLTVVTTPLNRPWAAAYDLDDLAQAVDAVSRIVPVWDFFDPEGMPDRPDLWIDESHFTPKVGHMMLARMFGDPMPAEWKHFGRLLKP